MNGTKMFFKRLYKKIGFQGTLNRQKYPKEKDLEGPGSAQFFDKSNFPAYFSNMFRTRKSAGNFELSKISTDSSRSNIFFLFQDEFNKNPPQIRLL